MSTEEPDPGTRTSSSHGADGHAYRYAAFISYRHTAQDRRWARWLHTAIETYRVPKLLRKTRALPARLKPLFRDEDELPASADLNEQIEQALVQSEYLIVICSPRTPASQWVNKEVLRFRELGRGHRILAILTEGEPAEAFPRALCEIRRSVVDSQGNAGETIDEVEPLAADVRTGRLESLRYLKRMARLRVLACLLNVRFDELRQRDHERRMRRLTVAGAGLIGLCTLLLGLTTYAIYQQQLAEQRRLEANGQRVLAEEAGRESRRRLVRNYESNARTLADRGQFGDALIWIAAAVDAAHDDPHRLALHHRWAGSLLSNCPRLEAVLPVETPITSLTFDATGQVLGAGGADKDCYIWDIPKKSPRFAPLKHDGSVGSVAFSRDGRFVATAASKSLTDVSLSPAEVRFWNLKTGLPYGKSRDYPVPIQDILFADASNRLLVTGGRVIAGWNRAGFGQILSITDDGAASVKLAIDREVFSSAVHLENGLLATGTTTPQLWNATTGTLQFDLTATETPESTRDLVEFVQFDHAGKRLFTITSRDNSSEPPRAGDPPDQLRIAIWDTKTGKPLFAPLVRDQGHCVAAFDPHGTHFAVSLTSAEVALHDADTGRALGRTLVHPEAVRQIRFSPDGRLLATCSKTQVRLWDIANNGPTPIVLEHSGTVSHLEFDPTGRRLAVAGERAIQVWDLYQTQTVKTFPFTNTITWAAINSSEGVLVTTRDNIAHAYKIGDELVPLHTGYHTSSIWDVEIDNNATHYILVGDSAATLWNLSPPERMVIDSPNGHNACYYGHFSPDGDQVGIASWYGISLHDATKERRIGRGLPYNPLDEHSGKGSGFLSGLQFAGSGKAIVFWGGYGAGHAEIARITKEGMTDVKILPHGAVVNRAAFSADENIVVTAGSDGKTRIWNTDTGLPTDVTISHDGPVWDVAFNPLNPSRLATTCVDGSARVWDWTTGRPVIPPLRHDGDYAEVKFAPREDVLALINGISMRRGNSGASSFEGRGRISLWDTETGIQLGMPHCFDERIIESAFSPNGDRLFVVTRSALHVINTAYASLDAVALSDSAQLLANGKLDDTGAIVRLDRNNLIERWKATRHAIGDGAAESAGPLVAARKERLARAIAEKNWLSIIQTVDTMLRDDPQAVEMRALRANASACLGLWSAAMRDYQLLCEAKPQDVLLKSRLGFCALARQDTVVYGEVCADLAAKFPTLKEPRDACLAAWLYCAAGTPPRDRTILDQMTASIESFEGPSDRQRSQLANLIDLINLRRAQLLHSRTTAEDLKWKDDQDTVVGKLVASIRHARATDPDPAQMLLDQGLRLREDGQQLPSFEDSGAAGWTESIFLDQLTTDAKQALESAIKPFDPIQQVNREAADKRLAGTTWTVSDRRQAIQFESNGVTKHWVVSLDATGASDGNWVLDGDTVRMREGTGYVRYRSGTLSRDRLTINHSSGWVEEYDRIDSLERCLAEGYEQSGTSCLRNNSLVDARRYLEESLRRRKTLSDAARNNVQAQLDLSHSYISMGDLCIRESKFSEARKFYTDSLGIAKPIADTFPDDALAQKTASVSYSRLGDLLSQEGNPNEARKHYADSLQINKRLADAAAGDIEAQRELIRSHCNAGKRAESEQEPGAAITEYRAALAVLKRMLDRGMAAKKTRKEIRALEAEILRLEKARPD
jgi:WD40 repeat protein/tetratricopeptide (TPR) repeat protein